jgi:hypothetical protein
MANIPEISIIVFVDRSKNIFSPFQMDCVLNKKISQGTSSSLGNSLSTQVIDSR